MTYILLFIVSLTVLLIAADKFVDAAEKIGLSFGIPSFIIGVTIVAFGTSLPELATSITSIFSGNSEIILGNVVGSNITNILLVLGVTAFASKKILLDFDVMDIDMPLLFASAFFLYMTISDLHLSVFEAILFVFALAIFLINSFKGDDKRGKQSRIDLKTWIHLILGAIFVYYGSHYTLIYIDKLAVAAEINPYTVSLILLALGTSLPELVVSVNAAKKGKTSIAVGNVLGSNIFNTYAVMAIPRFFGDITIEEKAIVYDLPFMIIVTILFGMICLTRKISRWEGAMLVVLYAYFIGYTIQNS